MNHDIYYYVCIYIEFMYVYTWSAKHIYIHNDVIMIHKYIHVDMYIYSYIHTETHSFVSPHSTFVSDRN